MQQGEVVVTLSSVPFPHVPGTFTIITAPQWIYLFFLGTIHPSFVTNKLAIHKLRRATYFLLAETPSPPCETVLAFRDVVFFFQGGNWTDSVSRPGEEPALCHPLLCCRAAPYHSRQLNVSEGTSVSPVQYLLPSIIPRLSLFGWITVAAKFCVKKFPRQRPLEGIYGGAASLEVLWKRDGARFRVTAHPAGLWYQICHG